MTSADVQAGLALSTAAGWNQRLDDWQVLLKMSNGTARVADLDAEVVGTAIGVPYTRWAWVAMVLVEPKYRRGGVGERLVQSVLSALPSAQPVGLDATPAGHGVYAKLGFVDTESVIRMVHPDNPRAAIRPGDGTTQVRQMRADDVADVLRADERMFPGRGPGLEWAYNDAPAMAWVTHDAGGIAGYCFGRRGRLFTQVGPIVASSDGVVDCLLAAALRSAPAGAIVVDVPARHAGLMASLDRLGFAAERTLHRMWTRADMAIPSAASLSQIAIFGPDWG